MHTEKRKQLLSDYKNSRTEMGIISVLCTATSDSFLTWSTDTKASINRTGFQLELGSHPNKEVQALWNQHGKDAFILSVIKNLPYDEKEPDKDYAEELAKLCSQLTAATPLARKLK